MKSCKFCHLALMWASAIFFIFLAPGPSCGQLLDSREQWAAKGPLGSAGVESVLAEASGGVVTLKGAIQQAMDVNPKFLAQKHAYTMSHDGYLQSYGELLPQLDFMARGGYGVRRNDTTAFKYSDGLGEELSNEQRIVLSQLLFDGGLTSSKVAADKMHSESKREEMYNAAEEVGLSATQFFMEVIRTRGVVELCGRNIAEHKKLLELTRVRLGSGGGTQADVTQALAALDDAKSRLIQARQAQADAEAGYARFFGTKPGALGMPERPFLNILQSEEVALGIALDGNRALKAARFAVEQKGSEVESAQGLLMPTFEAKLSSGRSDNTGGYESTYFDATAMLELSFNLYRGGSDSARIRKAKSDKLKVEQDAQETRRQVEEDIRKAYNFYLATGKLLPVLKSLADENAQVVSSYTDQFRMGKRSLVDLVTAQKTLFSSQQVYLNGMTAHTFSYYRMCAPASQLMSTLGIDLKVEGLGSETAKKP